ncbi:hypothetical protein LDENG_00068590 [Lucifuga dentata]|nr:hypothetical protein LDENG_00068590 [Lucifuga dentata]
MFLDVQQKGKTPKDEGAETYSDSPPESYRPVESQVDVVSSCDNNNSCSNIRSHTEISGHPQAFSTDATSSVSSSSIEIISDASVTEVKVVEKEVSFTESAEFFTPVTAGTSPHVITKEELTAALEVVLALQTGGCQGGCEQAEPFLDSSSVTPPDATPYPYLTPRSISPSLSKEELVCLGFPNLAQTCYMNSILQSLLTLSPFVEEMYRQQRVWYLDPVARLIRLFVDIDESRYSSDTRVKKGILSSFKRTLSDKASEFKDNDQKDAHEFMSCFLDQLRELSTDLMRMAHSQGMKYTCPVESNMVFQMLSTRTCNRCGLQSLRDEEFTNLSLDVQRGDSVSFSLNRYLMENQLDYRCDCCGARTSTQQWSFLTLPNILILHLKRFQFDASWRLKKTHDSVHLNQELLVGAGPDDLDKTQYSLVSVVSHLGSSAYSGHYISDGAHTVESGTRSVRWFTFNDERVKKTSGATVCKKRQQEAYLLFYQKQERHDQQQNAPASPECSQGPVKVFPD